MKITIFFIVIILFVFPNSVQAQIKLKLHKTITPNAIHATFKVKALTLFNDSFYAAEDNNIYKFNSSGRLVQAFEKVSSPTLNLSNPSSIVVGKTMKIYIADSDQNKIFIFNTFGKFISSFGQFGFKPKEFNEPVDLILSNQSQIYVLDYFNHRIQKFDTNFNLIQVFGSYGTGQKSFLFPQSMSLNHQNELLVIDKTTTIKIFDIFGAYRYSFKTSLNQKHKYQLKTDIENNIYLLNLSKPEIHIFNPKGKLIFTSTLDLTPPLRMYVGDYLYIAESSPLRVHVFKIIK